MGRGKYGRPALERFEELFIPEPNSGCWLWLNALNEDGYGHMKVGNKTYLSHRLSHELFVGPVPDDKCVMHECDTPSCVNPGHLKIGTWGDNNTDRHNKGRTVIHWSGLCKRGHDLDTHGYHRKNGTRYCATCRGMKPRPKNGAWL